MQTPKATQSFLYTQRDQNIWVQVEHIFELFDKDRSGTLQPQQLFNYFESATQKGVMKMIELGQFCALFQKIDQNKNRSISKQNLFEYLRNINQNTQKIPRHKCVQVDSPIHALVDKINKYQQNLLDQKVRAKVEEVFKKFDRNNSGQLDYYELNNYLQNQFGNKYNYTQFLKITDQNKDKLINKQELYTFYRKQIKI